MQRQAIVSADHPFESVELPQPVHVGSAQLAFACSARPSRAVLSAPPEVPRSSACPGGAENTPPIEQSVQTLAVKAGGAAALEGQTNLRYDAWLLSGC